MVTFPDEVDGPRLWLSQEEATDEGDELQRFEVLTCTTCGQHYFGHHLLDFELIGKAPDGGNAHGDSFYWDSAGEGDDGSRVVLVDRLIFDESEEDDDNVLDDSKKVASLHVCRFCGTAYPTDGDRCVGCGRQDARVQLYAVRTKEGRDAALTSCLACGSPGRRRYGRYREPARPVKATNVADVHVLSQSMLEHAERKRLLVFADDRQDAAFQAGWMQDHARRYRLRALMYECIERNNELSIGDLVFMLDEELDKDDNLSRTLLPEVWREVLEEWLLQQVEDGFEPREIAVFTRTKQAAEDWVAEAVEEAGYDWQMLRDDEEVTGDVVAIGTMHRAKGLEFKTVTVVGCNSSDLPYKQVLGRLSDASDRLAFIEQERSLLYVACTRARDRLMISHAGASSEFLNGAPR